MCGCVIYSKAIIAEAMDQFAKKSCIKIVPRTNQADYIHIMPESGCYSYVGRTGECFFCYFPLGQEQK